jgi:glycosyltransferase involved in cell wall biosynthesis
LTRPAYSRIDSGIKRKIFLLYPYYWPLYKAGGPVQSIFNIAATFKERYDFYFVSLTTEVDGQSGNNQLKVGEWNKGPNNERVYSAEFLSPFLLFRLIREVKPDVLLINGLFHWHTTFFGLIIGKMLRRKIIFSPRGMLQQWALNRGQFKKKMFFALLKLFLDKSQEWHATDEQERSDIKKEFGITQQVHLAANIPRPLGQVGTVAWPNSSEKIRLVFLSLINPNKNLHLIIETVNANADKFTLDIYGPVIDNDYWQMCKSKMKSDSSISYKGSISPWEVPRAIKPYHFFVLPTEGENFGHAIFDALSVGVPIIITRNTPWKEIDSSFAGFYVDIKIDGLQPIFNTIQALSASEYLKIKNGSIEYAMEYLSNRDFLKEYSFLD